jgi:hypothetical protein
LTESDWGEPGPRKWKSVATVPSVVQFQIRTAHGTDFTARGSKLDCHWRPFASRSIKSLTFHHECDITKARQKRKTYGRFLGAIFLKALGQRLFFKDNDLRGKQSPKAEKPQKKCEIFIRKPSIFFQNRHDGVNTPWRWQGFPTYRILLCKGVHRSSGYQAAAG